MHIERLHDEDERVRYFLLDKIGQLDENGVITKPKPNEYIPTQLLANVNTVQDMMRYFTYDMQLRKYIRSTYSYVTDFVYITYVHREPIAPKGHGRLLLESVIESLRDYPEKILYLTVIPPKIKYDLDSDIRVNKLLALYESIGFHTPEEFIECRRLGMPIPMILLIKEYNETKPIIHDQLRMFIDDGQDIPIPKVPERLLNSNPMNIY